MAEDQLSVTNAACNAAGGRSVIAALDENSNEAKNAAMIFAQTLREVLGLVPWDFATTTATLTAVPNPVTPMRGWTFVYQRPTDALIVQQVFDTGASTSQSVPIFPNGIGQNFVGGGKVRFATGYLGGIRVIYTNSSAPVLKYTRAADDLSQWSTQAIELLTITLAAKLAIPISGDKTLRDRLKQEQMQIEARVRTQAANENTDTQDFLPDWIRTREIGEWYGGAGAGGYWLDGSIMVYGG